MTLPHELQEIENELQEAARRKDWSACDALITRLAAEAELGKILADEAELALLETEEAMDTFPEICTQEAVARIANLEEAMMAGKITAFRYTYAVTRLSALKRAAE